MKEVTHVKNPTTPAATRPDAAEQGSRFRLPADEKKRREADFFMDMPRAGRAERERRNGR
jgi:hypothetical protein